MVEEGVEEGVEVSGQAEDQARNTGPEPIPSGKGFGLSEFPRAADSSLPSILYSYCESFEGIGLLRIRSGRFALPKSDHDTARLARATVGIVDH